MDEKALNALTRLELREAELLAWGATGAEWTADEVLEIFAEFGAGQAEFDRLLKALLIVRTPNGGYRSRSAETVRLLATLRQSFRHGRVTEGRPLVLDHRFLHRPRRRPERNITAQVVLDKVRSHLGDAGNQAAWGLAAPELSGFQQRSTEAVLHALNSGQPAGVMITAGTGSGKTLAFYLPLFAWLTDRLAEGHSRGTLALALYPRNELLKDQLRALLEYLDRMSSASAITPKISLATWFGQTPSDAQQVRNVWSKRKHGYACPFLRCLKCDGELLWREADLKNKPIRERLACSDAECGFAIEGDRLRLTRESALRNPATLMLTTTESLNRQLAAPGNLRAFGVLPATLSAVLLDEVHTYEGATGAQNALLLRRLTHAMRRAPVWVGLSATLLNAGEFFSRLVGLSTADTTVVQPYPAELVDSGAEYLLALRHNPHSRTGSLSASIQTGMALTRCLDNLVDDPFNSPPSSEGVVGKRVFVFTDKLDSTNRLYWDLSDAEDTNGANRRRWRRPRTLAHLRATEQRELDVEHRESTAGRDADGQWWWLPEQLGHELDADRSLRVGRTSSQDRGVESDAQIVVATATLEVGFDDDRVGAVIQHKAPHDPAQFLQRKGRAGRKEITRPWTVVVLSDWGRDRQAWDAYDALFDPELPPRNLPLENLYVLRIQAVYSLLDWLAVELRYSDRHSTWVDLAGPAEQLFRKPEAQSRARERQRKLSDKLGQLLRPGPERKRLRKHLREALALGVDEFAESVVDTLLWESPRPLLLAVVPTIRRRLDEQWCGEEPSDDDIRLQTRTPLRDFVPGNLFDDLLVPDVELLVPGRGNSLQAEQLPALRALREFCPGNVSRHFGVFAESRRHWVPLADLTPGESEIQVGVNDTFKAEFLDTIAVGRDRVTVHRPTAVTLQPVPDDVGDASSVAPDWEFHVTPLGRGIPVNCGRGADRLLADLGFHLHVQGGGVRTIRFARTARGTMWDQPAPRPVRLAFGTGVRDDWIPAAVGVDVHCDAVTGTVRLPDGLSEPTSAERTGRLRYLLTAEAELPESMSVFDCDNLVQVVTLVIAAMPGDARAPSSADEWTKRMTSAAGVLGLFRTDHHEGEEDTSWHEWFAEQRVLDAVREAVDEAFGDRRTASWRVWWQRGYTLSAAQLVLNALATRCPGVDTDELAVDLDPDRDDVFWLSERSPGGTGQVETFHRVLAQDPDAFSHALEDALRPTTADTADEELSALVRANSPEVAEALAALRSAWRNGHAAVTEAVRAVEEAALRSDINLGGPARSALSTRIAGPGAHVDLITTIVSWLDLRDRVARNKGISVDPRTLGALIAEEPGIDEVLQLGGDVLPERRARAVTNVLWPWGRLPQPPSAAYGRSPEVSFERLREYVEFVSEPIDIESWDGERRSQVHNALLEHGEVVLRIGHAQRDVLRAALLDLQTSPVEVGTLLTHPVAVGLGRSVRNVELRLLLREAL
ncbi:protein DpdJ [Amycolatopsis nigrescens]|uniref:protein DpdJ n=1 Tax=Amycolatopsis nigrescens TaxID=381445 RepID=UPI000374F118|nr:protein DpdJ [Amycolatopsis nigrescens]